MTKMESNLVINQDLSTEHLRTFYCRLTSNYQQSLEKLLTKVHQNAKYSLVVPSGMAAIFTVLRTLIDHLSGNKINLIILDEMYCETPKLCGDIANSVGGITLFTVDPNSQAEIRSAFSSSLNTYNIFLIEPCSNPNGKMIDHRILSDIKREYPNTYIVMDNTWLTHVSFDPTSLETVDAVVLSLTKYYSAGTAIAGAIVIPDLPNCLSRYQLFWWIKHVGYHVSPHNCSLIMKAMTNEFSDELMRVRLQQGHRMTKFAIQYLKEINHPQIVDIKYPEIYLSDNSKVQTDQSRSVEDPKGPCVFTIYAITNIQNIIKNGPLLKSTVYETSYGNKYNTLDCYPRTTIIVNPEGKKIKAVQLRISIGYESNKDDVVKSIQEIIGIL